MKTIGLRLALPAVLALAFVSPGRAIEHDVVPSKDFDARSNTAKPVMGCRGKVFVEHIRCRDWRDSNPNTLRIS
jgi:hypothetical protein